jgi:anti-repressor protein
MNDLQIFNNDEFGEIRTVVIDNEPWFVARDITERLGYQNGRDALYKHVDQEDKGVAKCDTLGGVQDFSIINESGLYSLILSSKLPEAKKFKHWVTSEVLPQIRKTGGYVAPRTYAEALRAYADEVEQRERLERERQELLPKAEFFDAVTDSKTAISIGETAKVLDAGIGQNKLFAFLRDNNILKSDNTPYQRYIDMGYFRVVEQKYEVNGEIRISIKTLVFQKGIDFIRRLLNKRGEL